MKTTISDAATCGEVYYRMLVLAPIDKQADQHIGALDSQGELAELKRGDIVKNIAIDALVGEVTVQDLSDALQDGGYDIVLIIAHGDEYGIMLNEYLHSTDLGRMLVQHSVSTILIMSCLSDNFAVEIGKYNVNNIITASVKVDNMVARKFTREFFRELIRSRSVVRSFDYARSRLHEKDANGIKLYSNIKEVDKLDIIMTMIREHDDALKTATEVFLRIHESRDQQIQNLTNAIFQLASAISLKPGARK